MYNINIYCIYYIYLYYIYNINIYKYDCNISFPASPKTLLFRCKIQQMILVHCRNYAEYTM